jgi:hypothetical protein
LRHFISGSANSDKDLAELNISPDFGHDLALGDLVGRWPAASLFANAEVAH